jgi:hypothetical protein
MNLSPGTRIPHCKVPTQKFFSWVEFIAEFFQFQPQKFFTFRRFDYGVVVFFKATKELLLELQVGI